MPNSTSADVAMNVPKSTMPGLELEADTGSLVLPGQILGSIVDPNKQNGFKFAPGQKRTVVRLGMGVMQRGTSVHSSKAGTLGLDERRNKVWIENNQKRYVPAMEDMVIGVVIERHSEEYRLDINGTDTATLSAVAFEGATKKNKPHLNIGSLVYCRITRASKNMEAEASCIEPGSSKSWVGGETLYGELKGGNVVQVSLGLARSLLAKNGPILPMLGEKIPFQSAVGVNGRVWVQAGSVEHTVLLSVAISNADTMPKDKWLYVVKKMIGQATT